MTGTDLLHDHLAKHAMTFGVLYQRYVIFQQKLRRHLMALERGDAFNEEMAATIAQTMSADEFRASLCDMTPEVREEFIQNVLAGFEALNEKIVSDAEGDPGRAFVNQVMDFLSQYQRARTDPPFHGRWQ